MYRVFRIRAGVALAAIWVLLSTASALCAADGPPKPPMNGPLREDDCSPIAAEEGWKVKERLLRFETVFGKPVMSWSEDDFAGLMALAKACHGVMGIDGNNYATMILAAHDQDMPVILVAGTVRAFAKSLKAEEVDFRSCEQLLHFRKDDWAMEDNSLEIFGRDFMAVSSADLRKVVAYANQCLLYLPDYTKATRGWRRNEVEDLLGKIMDRALFIVKRRMDWDGWPHRPSDVVIKMNGVEIPPTMASLKARALIMYYDKSVASGRWLTPETVGTLVKMEEEVMIHAKNAYDKAYAQRIHELLEEQIFRGGN